MKKIKGIKEVSMIGDAIIFGILAVAAFYFSAHLFLWIVR